MTFSVRIKNFGKLDDAEFHINKFTVFAGPNNSGKSFVSKLLYSILNGLRSNHAETYLLELIADIEAHISFFPALYLDELKNHDFDKLNRIVRDCKYRNLNDIENVSRELVRQANQIVKALKNIDSKQTELSKKPRFSIFDRWLIQNLTALAAKLEELDANAIVSRGMELELKNNFINNFQVGQLSQLASKENLPIEIDIQDLGKFKILDERISMDESDASIDALQWHSNLIYLESPVYWKLKHALRYSQRRSNSGLHFRQRRELSGVPQYFYDLADAIGIDYTGDIAFRDLYEKLTEIHIGGKMEISKDGDISYRVNGRSFSPALTAAGVANLGFLALLIKRKALDESAFIFIDAPEAHLHPAWQVVMAETLFELSKGGVHVVIATHSVDIMKWLDVHVQKNQYDKKLIALNQFPSSTSDNDNFEDKITAIKQELIKPFSDLYLDGL